MVEHVGDELAQALIKQRSQSSSPGEVKKRKTSVEEAEYIDSLCAVWIGGSTTPFSATEDSNFKKFVAALRDDVSN